MNFKNFLLSGIFVLGANYLMGQNYDRPAFVDDSDTLAFDYAVSLLESASTRYMLASNFTDSALVDSMFNYSVANFAIDLAATINGYSENDVYLAKEGAEMLRNILPDAFEENGLNGIVWSIDDSNALNSALEDVLHNK